MTDELNVAETLAQIKQSLRQERLRRTTDDTRAPPAAPPLGALLGQWASEAAGLPERPTLADIPALKSVAPWPVIGPGLALLREMYISLWLMTQRHAPWLQQVDFNMKLVHALQRLIGHVELMETLLIEMDRMQVDLNRRLYAETDALRALLGQRLSDAEADALLAAQAIAGLKFRVQHLSPDQKRLDDLEQRLQHLETRLDQWLAAQAGTGATHGR